jgi:hypothetical protein
MARNNKSMFTRTLILLVFAVVVFSVAFLILFGEIIVQEGNPYHIIRAALVLELTGAEIVPVSSAGTKLIQKTGPEEPLTAYLSALGWSFRERLGAVVFYEKDDATLSAEARMLTRRYVVFELDRNP